MGAGADSSGGTVNVESPPGGAGGEPDWDAVSGGVPASAGAGTVTATDAGSAGISAAGNGD
jgi:hypothetical protein